MPIKYDKILDHEREDDTQDVSSFLTQDGADGRYLLESNNLSDLDSAATARTNLGLVAGGVGDIWVEKAGDTMSGTLTIGDLSSADEEVVNEDMSSSPSTGTIKGDAAWNAGGYLLLTDAVNGQNGQFEYVFTDKIGVFDCIFDFWTGNGNGADAVWFYAWSSATPIDEDVGNDGFIIAFDELANEIQIKYDGNLLASQNLNGDIDLDDGTWRTARITYFDGVIKVYIDDVLKLTHDDSANSRNLTNTLFGWGARTGGLNNEHRIRNVILSLQDGNLKLVSSERIIGEITPGGDSASLGVSYTNGSEVGWKAEGLYLTRGRFDFDPLDGKVEFRIRSSPTFNIYDQGSGGAYMSLSVGAQGSFRNGLVINELGGDTDTRIEGDTDENLFFVDAGTDRIGVGESVPDYKLDINGAIGFTPGTSVTPVDNGDVVIEATNNTTLTFKLKGSDGTVRSGTVALS